MLVKAKMKPYSEACERNKDPILAIIKPHLKSKRSLLEIGSGTGQHAVYFSEALPHITWQTSDQKENHSSIKKWLSDSPATNVKLPLTLDVTQNTWPSDKVDSVYSANTAHIMSWEMVKCFFKGVGNILNNEGVFMLYGPFNYNGEFTSESNKSFENWLKEVDVERGIRDFESVNALAEKFGLKLINDYEMPANNRMLVWEKQGQ